MKEFALAPWVIGQHAGEGRRQGKWGGRIWTQMGVSTQLQMGVSIQGARVTTNCGWLSILEPCFLLTLGLIKIWYGNQLQPLGNKIIMFLTSTNFECFPRGVSVNPVWHTLC